MKVRITRALQSDSWVKPYISRYKGTLFLAIVLGLLTFFSAAALMFTSGYLISKSASQPINILLVYVPVVLTRAFGIGRPAFRYLERLLSHNWVFKVTSDLRRRLYLSLEGSFYSFTNKVKLGELLGLLSEDIGHLQDLYLRTVFPFIIAIGMSLILSIFTGFFSLFFALVLFLLLLVAIFVFPLVSLLRLYTIQAAEKKQKNALYVSLTDNVLGAADWVFSGRSEDFVKEHEAKERVLRQNQHTRNRFSYIRNFLFQLFFGGLVVVTLFWAASQFQGSHAGALNWIAAFVLAIFPLIDVFAPLSDAAVSTEIYADSITHLNELPVISKEKTERFTVAETTLEIDQVSFSYPGDRASTVLKEISLTLPPGEKLALLGKSGSGKSTLAKLVYGGIKPVQGHIRIGGKELSGDLTDTVGVIHQAPYLFNTTLANNIRIGKEEATDSEIWEVLEAVGLKSLVEGLPDQLETVVGEAGARFSGGEAHRLALARILLKNPPIVILDEATVGLDPITEAQVLSKIFEVLHDKTILFITHHLLGAEEMDRIVFLEQGAVKLDGTPQALKQESSFYQKLLVLDRGWL